MHRLGHHRSRDTHPPDQETSVRIRSHTHHQSVRARDRLTRVALCAAVATATASGAGIAIAEPTSDPAAVHCPRWTVLLVPGTFETTSATAAAEPKGVLAPVAESLKTRYGNDIEVRILARTADTAYSATEANGEQALTAALSGLCSGSRVVLAGHAEGAATVGDLAAAIGNNHGPIPASRVVAVGLVSDPHRDPVTTQLGNPVSGHGVAGPRTQDFADLTGRVRTLCRERDPYCSTDSEVSSALAAVARAYTATATSTAAPADSAPVPDRPSITARTTSTPAPTPATSPGQGQGQGQVSTTTTAPVTAPTVSGVLTQVLTVLNGMSALAANVPAILADLTELPALLASGDVRGLHRVAGDLNNRFHSLVAMAAGIDLRLVARALALAAPLDTTGVAALASQVLGVLAGLDIPRIATDIGRAQEIAWTAAEALTAGDPVAAVAALTGLAPVAADLLAATASAFTGTQFPSLTQTYTATTG
ncbi:cutinase family protein, partial [Nocardia ninae]|uniref:cutinase family protein n=1 Tax=Nocardia ninae TaxID=356145 RepID=UPI0039EF2D50